MKSHHSNKIEAEQKKLCPMVEAVRVIGGKWKLLIIYYLRSAKQRYSQLWRQMPTITSKMLAQQLRELVRDGIVTRRVYPVVPLKVEYSLTAKGRALLPILDSLTTWGNSLTSGVKKS